MDVAWLGVCAGMGNDESRKCRLTRSDYQTSTFWDFCQSSVDEALVDVAWLVVCAGMGNDESRKCRLTRSDYQTSTFGTSVRALLLTSRWRTLHGWLSARACASVRALLLTSRWRTLHGWLSARAWAMTRVGSAV